VTKYSDPYNSNHIVEIDNEDYLIQGKVDDPITMFRDVNELLECERSNVNVLMGELE